MYAVIQRYTFDSTSADEIQGHMQRGIVPLLRRTPGFAVFYWIDGGDGTAASLGVWEDAAAAEHSIELATSYIQQHLAGILSAQDANAGEAKIHITSGI